MEKTCNICGKKYNSTSELSLYCSRACKQKSYRNKVTKGVTELRNTVTEEQKRIQNLEAQALVLEALLDALPSGHVEVWDSITIKDVKHPVILWKKIKAKYPDAEICKKAKTLREAYNLIGKLND